MKKTIYRWSVFIILIVVTFGTGYVTYNYIVNDYSVRETIAKIPLEQQALIDIPRGAGTESIANILYKEEVIKNIFVFRLLSKINGYDGTYRSGTHAIEKDRNYNSLKGYDILMEILSERPLSNVGTRVTIPEGYNYLQIIGTLSKEGLVEKEEFNRVVDAIKFDFQFLSNIKRKENKLEGYLFPDTYEFDPKLGEKEKEIILKMLRRFDEIFIPEYYNRAKELGMTVDEVITLASIVEREAKVDEERPIIAGVFLNRLNSKNSSLRKLQSCATIQYILYKQEGKMKEIISLDDEEIEDPYNTYKYEGLPPGPICSPGRDSIEAVLYFSQHSYMYFVAKNDGTGGHYFSKTYSEHLGAQFRSQLNASKSKGE